MKQAVLSNFNIPWLPITGLIIFVMCFGLYTYWTYKKSNKAVYEQVSMLPLEEAPSERRN